MKTTIKTGVTIHQAENCFSYFVGDLCWILHCLVFENKQI